MTAATPPLAGLMVARNASWGSASKGATMKSVPCKRDCQHVQEEEGGDEDDADENSDDGDLSSSPVSPSAGKLPYQTQLEARAHLPVHACGPEIVRQDHSGQEAWFGSPGPDWLHHNAACLQKSCAMTPDRTAPALTLSLRATQPPYLLAQLHHQLVCHVRGDVHSLRQQSCCCCLITSFLGQLGLHTGPACCCRSPGG